MARDMLGIMEKLVALPRRHYGTAYDFLEKLVDPEWDGAAKRFLRKENPWPEIQKVTSSLLRFVEEVKPLAIKEFLAKDHFKVGEVEGVKIGYLGDSFKRAFFGTDQCRAEGEVAEATLRIHQLKKASVDSPIIAELGGEEIIETTLGQMFEIMKAQGHGQKGNLLVNGYANIFYIRSSDGVLWAVYCGWVSDYGCWGVSADSVTAPREWDAGSRVVSRDSSGS